MDDRIDSEVAINLKVPESTRTALKVIAAIEGRTMNDLACEILEAGLKEREKVVG